MKATKLWYSDLSGKGLQEEIETTTNFIACIPTKYSGGSLFEDSYIMEAIIVYEDSCK